MMKMPLQVQKMTMSANAEDADAEDVYVCQRRR